MPFSYRLCQIGSKKGAAHNLFCTQLPCAGTAATAVRQFYFVPDSILYYSAVPCASIASATFSNPAIFAPVT